MKLVHDVLDKQLVDREGRKFGKVDGIVIELREDEAPRVVAIETGFAVAAGRVSHRWEQLAVAIGKRLGVRKTPRYRIKWEKVLDVGLDIDVDIDGADSPPWTWEKWWRQHIPGK
jgi:sporulation protein YlmC with PRC-barrel domain